MAVLRLDRIMTAPVGAPEMLASHAALAAAVKMPLLGRRTPPPASALKD